jgi:hypothetical protein
VAKAIKQAKVDARGAFWLMLAITQRLAGKDELFRVRASLDEGILLLARARA